VNNLRAASILAWISSLAFLLAAAWPSFSDAKLPLLGLRSLTIPTVGWPLAFATLALAAALSLWPLWTPMRLVACAGFCAGVSLILTVYVSMILGPAFLAIAYRLRQAAREGEPHPPLGALVPTPCAPPLPPSSRRIAWARSSAALLSWIGALAFLGAAAWPSLSPTAFPLPGLRQLMEPKSGWPLAATMSALAAALSVPPLWNAERLVACGGFCLSLFAATAFYVSPAAAATFAFMAGQLLRAGDPGSFDGQRAAARVPQAGGDGR